MASNSDPNAAGHSAMPTPAGIKMPPAAFGAGQNTPLTGFSPTVGPGQNTSPVSDKGVLIDTVRPDPPK